MAYVDWRAWLKALLATAAAIAGMWLLSMLAPPPPTLQAQLPAPKRPAIADTPASDASSAPSSPADSETAEPSTDTPSTADSPTADTANDPEPYEPLDLGPQTYQRYVNLHVHLWSILWRWMLPWWPLAATALVIVLVRLFRPLPRTASRWSLGLDLVLFAGVAILAWTAAITVPNSDAQPVIFKELRSENKQLENGNREIVTTRESRHRHLPIEVDLHWVLLGGASSLLVGRRLAGLRRTLRSSDPATTTSST